MKTYYNFKSTRITSFFNRLREFTILITLAFSMDLHLAAQSYTIDDVSGQTLYLTSEEGVIDLYDSGGPNSNYQSGEDYQVTICSDVALAGCPAPPTLNCIFVSIDIEQNAFCSFDWLQIDNGPLYCNGNLPPLYGTTAISYVENEGGCITVHFHSDGSIEEEGFHLLFEADHPSYTDPNPLVCGSTRSDFLGLPIHGCPSCINSYECGGNQYDEYWAAEARYYIDAEGPVVLTVTGDVDFFVYGYKTNIGPNGCPPIYEIACGVGSITTVNFNASDYPYGIWFIVDGDYNSGQYNISLACNSCNPGPVDCGEVIIDYLDNGSSSISSYDCVGPDYPYNELLYVFTPEQSGTYTFHTYGYGGVAPAIIVSDCCNGGGFVGFTQVECNFCESAWSPSQAYNELEVALIAGRDYFIFIEKALNPSINAFQFWIDCNEPLDCSDAEPLECGDLVTGTNSAADGAINHAIDYCNNQYNYWTGREKIYYFYAPFTGQINLQLYNLEADLDLFVLDHCDAGACLQSGTHSGIQNETFSVNVLEGHTYYIVVDGFLAAESFYKLSLECEAAPCTECGDCFTYSILNKGLTSKVACHPKYIDCGASTYPSPDHSFQWTVDGVTKSTKYAPTLTLETGKKVKVCQVVKYLGTTQYRCCWDIQPKPGCAKPPVAHVNLTGEYDKIFNAGSSENGERYYWDFGDGSTLVSSGIDSVVEHTYAPGGYKYCSYVENDYGISTYCNTIAPGAIECGGGPNPKFTYTLNGRTITLKDVNNSAELLTSYKIDFGDSTALVQGNMWISRAHTFAKDSSYEICVRYESVHQIGSSTCGSNGCICFTVKINCCQQTIDQCYEMRPVFLSTNGGLEYNIIYDAPGIEVINWEIDNIPVANSTSNTLHCVFPGEGSYNVCCYYRNPVTGCYIRCCKRIYAGNPFACDYITYRYIPEQNGYQFELNRTMSESEEIFWTVDSPGSQDLGINLTSNILVIPSGACQEYVISVRFFDNTCSCYRLCCLRFYLCSPDLCNDLIKVQVIPNGQTKFYVDNNSFENMKWFSNGQAVGTGSTVTLNTSGVVQVCFQYFDPQSGCFRECCRSFTTATNELAILEEALIYPNPASDELNIVLSFLSPADVGVDLINEVGVVVCHMPTSHPSVTTYTQKLDLKDLPAGLYFVRVLTSQGNYTQRIVRL